MKTKFFTSTLLVLLLIISSCSNDDEPVLQDFVVAFENPSISLSSLDSEKDVIVTFSRTATENGTIEVKYTATNADYGTGNDFTTLPEANSSGIIILNVNNGDANVKFKFNKLINPIEGSNSSVNFEITKVNLTLGMIQGNTNVQVSFTETASLGASLFPETGGHNQPNQVYIDLSSQSSTIVKRDTWDFGFYSGDDFRVVLNSSIFITVRELDVTDIDAVTEASVAGLQDAMSISQAGSDIFVDDISGDIMQTAIKEISVTENDNKVYLVNAGFQVGTETPNIGSVAINGDHRGWKKIRITREGADYKLLYANLEDTTHEEAIISKKADYNFNFFSLNTEMTVDVEPEADKWDLNFTTFTNVIDFGSGPGAYGFSDFLVHNRKGGVTAYRVSTGDFTYEAFTKADVLDNEFSENQTTIGSSWRSVFTGSVRTDRFYILKDTDGNVYKLKFTALVNANGVRGHPQFEYTLLQ